MLESFSLETPGVSVQEQPSPLLSFEETKLSHIPLRHSERINPTQHRRGELKKQGSLKLNIQGKPFLLEAKQTIDDPQKDNSQKINLEYTLCNSEAGEKIDYVTGNIILSKLKNGDQECITIIEKENDHPSLKGIGLKLWKKLLDTIQDLSNAQKKSIRHKVTMNPEISSRDQPLSAERWLEIFGPILKQRSYRQIDEKTWERTYRPAKKSIKASANVDLAA